ncbi:MAG: hypothetical protein LKF36_00790 [Lactobacillus sp.]|nr:hypothetical protein [Lactobacillus sp.]
MKDLKKYTDNVTDSMADFFAEMMKDSSYRDMVQAEKAKLTRKTARTLREKSTVLGRHPK